MPLATKVGRLIFKSGRLVTNCACCKDGICPCVDNMPIAFAVRIKNVSLSFVGTFNNPGGLFDLSGYESELEDFAEQYELIATRQSVSIGSSAFYEADEDCYVNASSCVAATTDCRDATRYQFLSKALVSFAVLCNENIRNLLIVMSSSPRCWDEFPNNREDHDLSVTFRYPNGTDYPYEFCDDPTLPLELSNPPNFPPVYTTFAQWRVVTNNATPLGLYDVTSATVELEPLYTNPLP